MLTFYLSGIPGGQSSLYSISLSDEVPETIEGPSTQRAMRRVFTGLNSSLLLNVWDNHLEQAVLYKLDLDHMLYSIVLQSDELTVFAVDTESENYILEQSERMKNPSVFLVNEYNKVAIDRFLFVVDADFVEPELFFLVTESGVWLAENSKSGLVYQQVQLGISDILDIEYSDTLDQLLVLGRNTKSRNCELHVFNLIW